MLYRKGIGASYIARVSNHRLFPKTSFLVITFYLLPKKWNESAIRVNFYADLFLNVNFTIQRKLLIEVTNAKEATFSS